MENQNLYNAISGLTTIASLLNQKKQNLINENNKISAAFIEGLPDKFNGGTITSSIIAPDFITSGGIKLSDLKSITANGLSITGLLTTNDGLQTHTVSTYITSGQIYSGLPYKVSYGEKGLSGQTCMNFNIGMANKNDKGFISFIVGRQCETSGCGTFVQGDNSKVFQSYGVAFGSKLLNQGKFTFAQGQSNITIGEYSHTEGRCNTTLKQAIGSHIEGLSGIVKGMYSHVEGFNNNAYGNYSHNEGQLNITSGNFSHAEGGNNITNGLYSHAEGQLNLTIGDYSHTEGLSGITNGSYSHTEGNKNITNGHFSHAEGQLNITSGNFSHAEGGNNITNGSYSHTEGFNNITYGDASHAEGRLSITSGQYSHTEGDQTKTIGSFSHAEGRLSITSGQYSHTEGDQTKAIGSYSHAEGQSTQAIGNYSHTEGANTITNGKFAHAEGAGTQANNDFSHAQGFYNKTSQNYQHVEGKWNIPLTGYQHIVGGGDQTNRKNIQTLDWDGNLWNAGVVSGTDFVINNSEIKLSKVKDYVDDRISAIISGAPSALDTLKEIADALSAHHDIISGLIDTIGTKQDIISTTNKLNTDYLSGVLIDKVDGIEAGAQVNALTGIIFNGSNFKPNENKIISLTGSYYTSDTIDILLTNKQDLITQDNKLNSNLLSGNLSLSENDIDTLLSGINTNIEKI